MVFETTVVGELPRVARFIGKVFAFALHVKDTALQCSVQFVSSMCEGKGICLIS